MSAVEARVEELILPPLDSDVRAGLRRAALEPGEACQGHARIAAFVSAKGGSGATTVACHVAAALARLSRRRVLLADCDLDLPLIGFLTRSATPNSLLDAARNLPGLDEAYWNNLVFRRGELDVLPFPKGCSDNFVKSADVRQVFGFLRPLYGWVVVDLGRGLAPLFQPVLADFDDLFVVSTLSVPAISQARHLLQRVAGSGAPPVRLVLNRVAHAVHMGADAMRPLLGAPVAAEIGEDSALDEAYAEGRLAGAATALGRDVEVFAARLAGLPAPRSSRWRWFEAWRKPMAL